MLKFFKLIVPACIAVFFAVIAGCGDTSTTPTTTYVDNPNVKSFDSVGIVEDSSLSSLAAIVFINGTNTNVVSPDRDVSLTSKAGDPTYTQFFLRSGTLVLNKLDAGFETRFFRVDPNMTTADFDSLSKIQGYDSLRSIDFTQESTEFWGYFTAPLDSYPVYCFWLKGRNDAVPSGKKIFGIIQPREATDNIPGSAYGFRISYRIRININGENDFRKRILQ